MLWELQDIWGAMALDTRVLLKEGFIDWTSRNAHATQCQHYSVNHIGITTISYRLRYRHEYH